MLHHLPDDAKVPALREGRRVLQPDGRLVVLDLGADGRGHGHAAPWRRHERTGHGEHGGVAELVRAPGLDVERVTPVRARLGSAVLVTATR